MRRIGDDKLIPVDVRVIVATNKDIAQLVRERSFREDLYYRLNVLPLHLLPLRERRADILPLAREFYREMASSLPKLSLFDVFFAGKLDELMQYDFRQRKAAAAMWLESSSARRKTVYVRISRPRLARSSHPVRVRFRMSRSFWKRCASARRGERHPAGAALP